MSRCGRRQRGTWRSCSVTGTDFRKAEVTSIPVSLILLLVVFAADRGRIPLLLARHLR